MEVLKGNIKIELDKEENEILKDASIILKNLVDTLDENDCEIINNGAIDMDEIINMIANLGILTLCDLTAE
jgi:hypothetical protein